MNRPFAYYRYNSIFTFKNVTTKSCSNITLCNAREIQISSYVPITHCDISFDIFWFDFNIIRRSWLSWEDNIKNALKKGVWMWIEFM
jgi:hypothetical protein